MMHKFIYFCKTAFKITYSTYLSYQIVGYVYMVLLLCFSPNCLAAPSVKGPRWMVYPFILNLPLSTQVLNGTQEGVNINVVGLPCLRL